MKTYKKSRDSMFSFGMRTITLVVVLAVTLGRVQQTHATPIGYTDELSYLVAVDSYGFDKMFEGFEGSDWGITRGDGIPGSLTSGGITWSSSENLATITGSFWVRSGSYGVYDRYGDPDMIVVQTAGTVPLTAIGGWFASTNPTTINFEIDGQVVATRVLEESNVHKFLGIIDPAGFITVSFTTPSGHWGADDFTIVIPEPCSIALLGLSGLALLRKRTA